jgi:hypothetical protein
MATPAATARHFDLYPVEFLEGISDLDDPYQLAAYTVVIMLVYARRGPVPNDPQWIGRQAHMRRASDCRRALDQLIAKGKLFLTDDGRLMNGRARQVLDLTVARIEHARVNGQAGGRPPSASISHRSRRDLVTKSHRSPTRSESNQPLAKPRRLHSSTTNQLSSSSSTDSEAARASRPATYGPPARAPDSGEVRPAPNRKIDPRLEDAARAAREKLMKRDPSA